MSDAPSPKVARTSAMRWVWRGIGTTAMIAGLIGIVLPVVPTSPFVILAAFAFGKSSPRIERWLVEHRIFGPMIVDWRANGAIAPKYKAMATTMMVGAFCLSLWLRLPPMVLGIQALCLLGAATFVLSRPNGKA